MANKDGYNSDQLRGAYRAGYEAGFADGRESLRKEGWFHPQAAADCPTGSIVKLLVRTVGGWKGLARVIYASGEIVHAQKLDYPDEDYDGTVDALLDQVMVRR